MEEELRSNEIDLWEIVSALWSDWKAIVSITFFFFLLAIFYSFSLPNIYQSSALLSPSDDSGAAVGGLLGQYSGMASMAGVALPIGNEVPKATLAMEVIKSRAFAKEFISKHDILPELLAVDHWDAVQGQLIIDPKRYDSKLKTWNARENDSRPNIPSDQEAFKKFKEILRVDQDRNSSFITISIKHESPVVAQRWVSWLVDDVNEAMRRKEMKEAQESIEYLKKKVTETTIADLDQVFFELMQAQMQRMMLAEVRREYVFTTIDPAVIAESSSEPNRALISVIGVLIGVLIGFLRALVLSYVRKEEG